MGKIFGMIAALLLLLSGSAAALAQDATPAARGSAMFADTMGLPELRITASDTALEGVPAETAAGRYLVTLTNSGSEDAAAGFLQLPEGVTAADLAALGGPPPGVEGTPAAGGETAGTPAADGNNGGGEDGPPPWFYQTYIAGGAGAGAGQTAQAIVDLLPGSYAVWGEDPEAKQPPVALTVTGEMPADLAEPTADVTVNEVGTNEGFRFSLDGDLAVGPQTIKVYNHSDQPHFLILLKSPGPITEEQVQALLTFDPSSGTPLPSDTPDPDKFTTAAYMSVMSQGTVAYLASNLDSGYYVMLCFISDPKKGHMPHAAEGMAQIFEVGQ